MRPIVLHVSSCSKEISNNESTSASSIHLPNASPNLKPCIYGFEDPFTAVDATTDRFDGQPPVLQVLQKGSIRVGQCKHGLTLTLGRVSGRKTEYRADSSPLALSDWVRF
jgi:hypothetical protein